MHEEIRALTERVQRESSFVEILNAETGEVIVGQTYMMERVLIGLLCDGHVLLEGVPGLAKTLAVRTLADSISAQFSASSSRPISCRRTSSARSSTTRSEQTSRSSAGPSSPTSCSPTRSTARRPRCSRALLEAMQERQVTHRRQDLPPAPAVPRARHAEPHRAGGHLPAARSAGRSLHAEDQGRLSDARGGEGHHGAHDQRAPAARRPPVVDCEQIARARAVVNEIYVDRQDRRTTSSTSSSPRASREGRARRSWPTHRSTAPARARPSSLVQAARAHAFLRHRGFVTPEDVKAVGVRRAAPPHLRSPTRPKPKSVTQRVDRSRGCSIAWRCREGGSQARPRAHARASAAHRDPHAQGGRGRAAPASTTRSSRAAAWRSPRCAPTSPATRCAPSTGTSPRARRRRTSRCSTRSASSR